MIIDRSVVHEILQQIVTEGTISSNSKGFNFRCVVCGDSKKSKSKKRGWVLFDVDKTTYFCFNCDTPHVSFVKFIKEKYPLLHEKYFSTTLDNVNFKKKHDYDIEVKIIENKNTKFDELEDLSDVILPHSFNILDENVQGIIKSKLQIEALILVKKRKIPREIYKDFLVCYEENKKEDHDFSERIIIPYYVNDLLYCFQGRALRDRYPKYLTFNKENIKIYNYYGIDVTKDVCIFEGPIDSGFVYNSIATSGTIKLGGEQFLEIKKKFPNRIWCFDNDEAGYKQTIKFSKAGERVFLWPKKFKKFKDINDLVIGYKKELSKAKIYAFIQNNSFGSLEATAKIKLGK